MIFLTILSALTIVSLVCFAAIKSHALPACISDCYYAAGTPFTLIFFAAAWLALVPAMQCWASGVTIFMIFFLSMVGVAADYKDETYHCEHVAAAVLAALFSLSFVRHVDPPSILLYGIAVLSAADRKRWLLYCETSCFTSVYSAMLTRLT